MKRLSIAFVCLFSCVGCGSSGSASATGHGAGAPGAAGAGGTGGAGTGGGGAGGMLGAPEWLAYVAVEGNFAHDAATYPATDALTLSPPPAGLYMNSAPPHWSPDGTRLAYFAGDRLEVREMTTHDPSLPVTMASGLTPSDNPESLEWSPDSKTISFISGQSLYTADPSATTTTPSLVTSKDLQLYQWAPTGNGLVFRDTDGVSYVRVTAGVPNTPQPVVPIGNSWGWSRDGKLLVVENGLDIILFDVSGATLAPTPVVSRSSAHYYADPAFAFDGSLFAFNADEGVYYASTGTPSAITLVDSPVSGAVTQGISWHPKEPVMAFSLLSSPTVESGTWFYVKFSAGVASTPTRITGSWQYLYWLPDRLALLATDPTSGQLSLIDLTGTTPVVRPYEVQSDPVFSVMWAPVGNTLAFATRKALLLASQADPTLPTNRVSGLSADVDWFGWSRTASYLAVLSTSSPNKNDRLELVRVDDRAPSQPMPVHASVPTTASNFSWQP